ncbi:uncharacterized protein LOC124352593 [Daphnia pulicaria]|uniref:uncharacterized protein LOC124352593 n=1 Tax=Daphnia pulicaria TaxID=35523 RepID=UPI001EEA2AD3|nr:uncharacterized protein LOC124352593 [Daphnia pulicaria]
MISGEVIIGFVGQRKKLFSRDNVSRLAVPNIVQLTCNFSTDLTKEDLAIAIKIATQYIILMELLIVHLNTRKIHMDYIPIHHYPLSFRVHARFELYLIDLEIALIQFMGRTRWNI